MKKLIALSVIVLAIAVGVDIFLGFFPVASVNGSLIWYRDVRQIHNATEHLRTFIKTGQAPPEIVSSVHDDSDKAILEELIVRKIIEQGAAEFRSKNIDAEIEKDVNDAIAKAGEDRLTKAVAGMYGESFQDFRQNVIVPRIREVVVKEKVEAEGRDFGEWLRDKAKNTRVKIYFLPYRWNETQLENK